MQYAALISIVLVFASFVQAEVQTKTVEYRHGDVTFKGFLAYDDAITGKRPAVLVFPEWWGVNDYPKGRAKQLAGMGYVALVGDLYGGGKTTTDPKEAASLSGSFKANRAELCARARAALDTLKADPHADTSRVAVIGYCFGGTTALELARSGADVQGVATFHAGLDVPDTGDASNIRAKILVMTGGDDPNVPPAVLNAFEDQMRKGKVDWEVVVFGGAVHSFTNPASGSDPSRGVAYNAQADHRSWEIMKLFFGEIFEKK